MLPLIESNREQLQKMSGSRKGRDFFSKVLYNYIQNFKIHYK